ncbi:uncharacterized protein LOC135079168 [Ostrinia nubilalis]|uniref:uncharacterized protein LOC135079168 n=1 Tax=Ostrinia nubilalis TaxID=29057 RepID=UPI0030826AFF
MNKIFQLVLLCYISLIVFILIESGDANEEKTNNHVRQRRYLSFKNKTKFFLRLNFKANMVPWTQIFAQALGFRMNWDAPPDTFHPYKHFSRRSVYNHLEHLLDRQGLNGHQCVRRAICEMEARAPRGIYHKILKMVFRKQSSDTDKWHNNTTKEDCLVTYTKCPFSFLDISQYTDL